jgi:predicted RNA binding protein YcfA (HicA-like mRNA interferase family)
MVKPAKLYALLLQSTRRSVAFRDFIALIEAFGFVCQRIKGSHRSYRHPDCPKLLVIQPLGNEAASYQVREFLALVTEYGLNMDS